MGTEADSSHRLRAMGGRDPNEAHRAATPLELLFDLTFVICFGLAASQFAHLCAEGHWPAALMGFGFAGFAICWAWINFAWFASAYDTDDWVFRVATMVQMIGVLLVAMGLPRMFASLDAGAHLDIRAMVVGYVVMRGAMVFQWIRASRQDPARRRVCQTYAVSISVAQVGWIALAVANVTAGAAIGVALLLALVEMVGPWLAERKDGGTPWHAHHIAERYSLFAIIALGEGVVGAVAALSAVVDAQGWTVDAALVCVAGVGLTFGMWWIYFMLPSAPILSRFRDRCFGWGYGQILLISSIVATGAGLHVAAYFLESKSHIGRVETVLCTAIPVLIYILTNYALYTYLVQRLYGFKLGLFVGTVAVVGIAIGAALLGVSMPVCLVILSLAPVVSVVGFETRGYRHQAEYLARIAQDVAAQ